MTTLVKCITLQSHCLAIGGSFGGLRLSRRVFKVVKLSPLTKKLFSFCFFSFVFSLCLILSGSSFVLDIKNGNIFATENLRRSGKRSLRQLSIIRENQHIGLSSANIDQCLSIAKLCLE